MLNAARRMATLPREARDTLFLLAVIGWIVLPHLSRLPWWCALLAGTVLAWRGTLAATVLLILFSAGVFIYGIQLQIPLWPTFLH